MKIPLFVLLIFISLLDFIQCDRTKIRGGLLGASRSNNMNYDRKSLQKKFEITNKAPKTGRRVKAVSSFNTPSSRNLSTGSRNLPWIGKGASKKGKGKGSTSKGKGMGKGMSMGKGKGKGSPIPPPIMDDQYDDMIDDGVDDDEYDDFLPPLDDMPPPDGCELMTFNETFVVPAATLFMAPDTNSTYGGTPELPGTLFIFETANILEPDGITTIRGTTVTGTCTRTSFTNTTTGTGGGMCQFTFVDDDDFTINVGGYLMNMFGSPLAISGGTGGMVGVIGQMDFFPVYPTAGTTGDVFLDPLRYEVIADLGLIVCA